MTNTDKTKKIILSYESKYSAQLGRFVMNKPKLSSLMIFIPFLFIFFIQDLLKYRQGRKNFSVNFLLSREKAINEAIEAINEQRKINTKAIAEQADLGKKAGEKYSDFLEILTIHYISLLKAGGNDYESLIRSAYNNKKTYKAFTEQLMMTEKILTEALSPRLSKNQEGVAATIKKIEKGNKQLRQTEIEEIFIKRS